MALRTRVETGAPSCFFVISLFFSAPGLLMLLLLPLRAAAQKTSGESAQPTQLVTEAGECMKGSGSSNEQGEKGGHIFRWGSGLLEITETISTSPNVQNFLSIPLSMAAIPLLPPTHLPPPAGCWLHPFLDSSFWLWSLSPQHLPLQIVLAGALQTPHVPMPLPVAALQDSILHLGWSSPACWRSVKVQGLGMVVGHGAGCGGRSVLSVPQFACL